ncbi:hypothetical protein ABK040_007035 [Willaertia magna]
MADQATVTKSTDLYIPRQCTATKNLITAKDHASVQLNIALVDDHGVYTNEYTTVAFCGDLRMKGKSDAAMNRAMIEKKVMKDIN